jgi:hypothetical protein
MNDDPFPPFTGSNFLNLLMGNVISDVLTKFFNVCVSITQLLPFLFIGMKSIPSVILADFFFGPVYEFNICFITHYCAHSLKTRSKYHSDRRAASNGQRSFQESLQ